MSVLNDVEIRDFALGSNLIAPFAESNLQGASYDMRLGPLMVVGGQPRHIGGDLLSHTLQPGDFALLTTLEYLDLPVSLIGHNGIMSPWARRGLVSLFSPQIDPGFHGPLEVPVFNAGDAPVVLIPGQAMFTVEFVRMSKPASFSWSARYGEKVPPSQPLPPVAVRANLQDVDSLKKSQTQVNDAVKATDRNLAALANRLDLVKAQLDARLDGINEGQGKAASRRSYSLSKKQFATGVVALCVAILAGLVLPRLDWNSSGVQNKAPSVSPAPTTTP